MATGNAVTMKVYGHFSSQANGQFNHQSNGYVTPQAYGQFPRSIGYVNPQYKGYVNPLVNGYYNPQANNQFNHQSNGYVDPQYNGNGNLQVNGYNPQYNGYKPQYLGYYNPRFYGYVKPYVNGRFISQAKAVPLTEFACFSRLPMELQLKIWKLTLPAQRVVKLRFSGKGLKTECISIARIPAALHVCRTSREVALTVYQLSFGVENLPVTDNVHCTIEPKVYFSFERDILFLDTEYRRMCAGYRGLSNKLMRKEAERLHNLLGHVQGLDEVQSLAAWEGLPGIGTYAVTHEGDRERSKIKNPWSVFKGLKEPVKSARIGCSCEEKDLWHVKKPDLLYGKEWEQGYYAKLISKLDWEQAVFIDRPLDWKILALLEKAIREME